MQRVKSKIKIKGHKREREREKQDIIKGKEKRESREGG